MPIWLNAQFCATRVQRGHDPGEQRGIGLVAIVVGRDGEALPEGKPSADLGEVGRSPPGDDADLRDAEGRNVPLDVVDSGEFFGEVAMVTGEPRQVTAKALTQVQVLELDRDIFLPRG